MNQFLTLSQLAKAFDLSEKQLRYKFKQLLQGNKLEEGQDYIRADYKDELHFVWKLNPVTFMEKSGLSPTPRESVAHLGSQDPHFATKDDDSATQPDDLGSKLDSKDDDVAIKESPDAMMDDPNERLIDALQKQVISQEKQIVEKDSQLNKKDEQIKRGDEKQQWLNENLNHSANLNKQMFEENRDKDTQIKRLLMLPGVAETVREQPLYVDAKEDELATKPDDLGSKVDSKNGDFDSKPSESGSKDEED